MSFPELQTNRLILRAFQPDDYFRLRYLYSDFDVSRMTSSMPHPLTNEGAQALLSRFMSGNRNGNLVWAIDNGTGFIGSIEAKIVGDHAELSYALGKYYWRRGYMSEAVEAVVNHIKNAHEVVCVEACVFLENFASLRVLVKNGFEPAGTSSCLCEARKDAELATQDFQLHIAQEQGTLHQIAAE